jgi:hypothetical protein
MQRSCPDNPVPKWFGNEGQQRTPDYNTHGTTPGYCSDYFIGGAWHGKDERKVYARSSAVWLPMISGAGNVKAASAPTRSYCREAPGCLGR